MNKEQEILIKQSIKDLPTDLLGPKASEQDILSFESQFEVIPETYKWILKNCGKVLLGSDFTDNIQELEISHQKFKEESSIENGWTMKDVFIIGWDGAGNPFGIEKETGRILIEYMGEGEVTVLANSIEELIKP